GLGAFRTRNFRASTHANKCITHIFWLWAPIDLCYHPLTNGETTAWCGVILTRWLKVDLPHAPPHGPIDFPDQFSRHFLIQIEYSSITACLTVVGNRRADFSIISYGRAILLALFAIHTIGVIRCAPFCQCILLSLPRLIGCENVENSIA